jgi:hypothetical protein
VLQRPLITAVDTLTAVRRNIQGAKRQLRQGQILAIGSLALVFGAMTWGYNSLATMQETVAQAPDSPAAAQAWSTFSAIFNHQGLIGTGLVVGFFLMAGLHVWGREQQARAEKSLNAYRREQHHLEREAHQR